MIFGLEGKYRDDFDGEGMPQFTGDYVSDAKGVAKVDGETGNFQWNGYSNFLDMAKAKFTASLPMEERRWDTHWQYEIIWKIQVNGTEFENINALPDSEEGRIKQSVDEIAEETRAKELYAKSDEEVATILATAAQNANNLAHKKTVRIPNGKMASELSKNETIDNVRRVSPSIFGIPF